MVITKIKKKERKRMSTEFRYEILEGHKDESSFYLDDERKDDIIFEKIHYCSPDLCDLHFVEHEPEKVNGKWHRVILLEPGNPDYVNGRCSYSGKRHRTSIYMNHHTMTEKELKKLYEPKVPEYTSEILDLDHSEIRKEVIKISNSHNDLREETTDIKDEEVELKFLLEYPLVNSDVEDQIKVIPLPLPSKGSFFTREQLIKHIISIYFQLIEEDDEDQSRKKYVLGFDKNKEYLSFDRLSYHPESQILRASMCRIEK